MARDKDRRTGKGARDNDRRRVPKKKTSVLITENIQWVDYKDVNLLRRFMSERAKIRARRVTGNTTQQQRAVARAIRNAREMALLPYSIRQVTQRNKGGRRDRDRDRDRGRDRGRESREESRPAPKPPEGSKVPEGASVGAAAPDQAGPSAAPAPPTAPATEATPESGGGESS